MPRPGYVNTPYGEVPINMLGKGPTFSEATAKQFKPGQVVGGYVDWATGLCRPIIPNPIKADTGIGGGGGGGGGSNPVKTANTNNYVESVLETRADLSAEERLAFMALTGNEILEVLRNFDMSNNSLNLNKNIVDSVIVVNSLNPVQLIKMPNTNNEYLNNSSKTTEGTTTSTNQTTGNTILTGPANDVSSSSSTSNTTAQTSNNTNKIQVETSSPAKSVTQQTTPPHALISFTPTSAKKGTKITVTHQRCNVSPKTFKIGPSTFSVSSMTSTTFKFTVPNSLTVGQQYELSMTIGGVVAKAPGTLTVLA